METEGLVFMGAGGSPVEWQDGIAQMLIDEGIASSIDIWTEVEVKQIREDRTDLVFGFKNLDIGKLALWRLKVRHIFDVVWLSDYNANRAEYTGMVL